MTNAEAVEILECMLDEKRASVSTDTTNADALDLAISALMRTEKYRKQAKRFKRKYLALRKAVNDIKIEIESEECWNTEEKAMQYFVLSVFKEHLRELK